MEHLNERVALRQPRVVAIRTQAKEMKACGDALEAQESTGGETLANVLQNVKECRKGMARRKRWMEHITNKKELSDQLHLLMDVMYDSETEESGPRALASFEAAMRDLPVDADPLALSTNDAELDFLLTVFADGRTISAFIAEAVSLTIERVHKTLVSCSDGSEDPMNPTIGVRRVI